ncbi:hypothetical protein C1634_022455 [Chryseobacterium viscerum]|uniref:Uncharacterized protein n=1 Tax=Chryseobacterium viscerum TaxID=1037377 RepID=A0A316WAJ7_9FLAO|nr:hypothetical protein C1634_022455 [Chryseobacterium viscerum]
MSNKKETTKKQFVNHMLLETQELQYQFNDPLLELIDLRRRILRNFGYDFRRSILTSQNIYLVVIQH